MCPSSSPSISTTPASIHSSSDSPSYRKLNSIPKRRLESYACHCDDTKTKPSLSERNIRESFFTLPIPILAQTQKYFLYPFCNALVVIYNSKNGTFMQKGTIQSLTIDDLQTILLKNFVYAMNTIILGTSDRSIIEKFQPLHSFIRELNFPSKPTLISDPTKIKPLLDEIQNNPKHSFAKTRIISFNNRSNIPTDHGNIYDLFHGNSGLRTLQEEHQSQIIAGNFVHLPKHIHLGNNMAEQVGAIIIGINNIDILHKIFEKESYLLHHPNNLSKL